MTLNCVVELRRGKGSHPAQEGTEGDLLCFQLTRRSLFPSPSNAAFEFLKSFFQAVANDYGSIAQRYFDRFNLFC
jgi:hypothetical protein